MLWRKRTLAIVKNKDIQWKLIEQRAVLLHIDSGVVLQLDAVATALWNALDGRRNFFDLVTFLTENFEVERKQAARDTRDFLRKLLKEEAICYAGKDG